MKQIILTLCAIVLMTMPYKTMAGNWGSSFLQGFSSSIPQQQGQPNVQTSNTHYIPPEKIVSYDDISRNTAMGTCIDPWADVCLKENLCDISALSSCIAHTAGGDRLERHAQDIYECDAFEYVRLLKLYGKVKKLRDTKQFIKANKLLASINNDKDSSVRNITQCEANLSTQHEISDAKYEARKARIESEIAIESARREVQQARAAAEKAKQDAASAGSDADYWQSKYNQQQNNYR